MGGDEEGEEGPTATDLRNEWLQVLVLGTLKVKAEKWAEMDEEALFPIKDFMDTNAGCLFVTLGDRDKICTSTSTPAFGLRKKSCFFLKATTRVLHMTRADIVGSQIVCFARCLAAADRAPLS